MKETSDFPFSLFLNSLRKGEKKHTHTTINGALSIHLVPENETPARSAETRGLGALLPFTSPKITASGESRAHGGGETVNYEG